MVKTKSQKVLGADFYICRSTFLCIAYTTMDINRRCFVLMLKLLDGDTGCSCLNDAESFWFCFLSLLRYYHQRSDSCRGTEIFVLLLAILHQLWLALCYYDSFQSFESWFCWCWCIDRLSLHYFLDLVFFVLVVLSCSLTRPSRLQILNRLGGQYFSIYTGLSSILTELGKNLSL